MTSSDIDGDCEFDLGVLGEVSGVKVGDVHGEGIILLKSLTTILSRVPNLVVLNWCFSFINSGSLYETEGDKGDLENSSSLAE